MALAQLSLSVGSPIRARTLTHTHTLLRWWGVSGGGDASSHRCGLLSAHGEGSAPMSGPAPPLQGLQTILTRGRGANEVTGHCDPWGSSKGTSRPRSADRVHGLQGGQATGQLPSLGPRTPSVLGPRLFTQLPTSGS